MWKEMGLVGVVLCAGCVEDFDDGFPAFANGCSRDLEVLSAQVVLQAGAGECKTVTEGTMVRFERTGFHCTLRGGKSWGDDAEWDSSNPIEAALQGGVDLLDGGADVLMGTGGTFPYYCDENKATAGAIFVK